MPETPSDGKPAQEIAQALVQPQMHATPSETGEEAIAKLRTMGRKKLAIVGFAPSSYKQAPFHDPSWEIWSLNEAYTLPGVSRADRWFEMHIRQEVDISTRDPNHIKWLRDRRDMPIYMIRNFSDIPMSVEYPVRDIVRKYGQYLTNTITFEILLAIEEGFETIGVWGVDMAQGGIWGQPSEYAEQRPSCEWALGIAQGKGINVYVPPESDLLKSPGLYGYEGDGSQMRMKIRGRIGELQGRVQGLAQQLEILNRNRLGATGEATFIGRLNAFFTENPNATQAEIGTFCGTMKTQIEQALVQWEQQANGFQIQKWQLEGAADDCLYWLRKYVLPTFASDVLNEIEGLDAKRNVVIDVTPKEEEPV